MEGESLATKSRWPIVEKFFPVVVDDFFREPEAIVNWGKQLPKEVVGNQPGKRSKQLWELDPELHNTILKKILSCYYDLDYMNLSWQVSNMSFHEIPRFHEAKSNIKNKGWIHQDVDVFGSDEVAGLIYLTPGIDEDSGTSLFNLKPNTIIKSEEESKELGWVEHRKKFDEKLCFKNFFNRMIMYDSCEWHAANSYWNDGDVRLTLAFFIGGIEASTFPLKRVKHWDRERSICG